MSSIIYDNCNPTPASSCMYSVWSQKNSWMTDHDFYSASQISPFEEDYKSTKDEEEKSNNEKHKKTRGYKHVPHKDKPAQVVAKRNARERRRVQAVNNAFSRLRKAVPFDNARGKRISKVKTLQNAIDYIQNLENLLQEDVNYQQIHLITNFYPHKGNEDYLESLQFQEEEL